MTRKYFGTDGIRGLTNTAPMTAATAMKAGGYNIGGEHSGHLILADHSTTGDGLVAALQVLAALVASGKPASEVLHLFDPLPQLLKSVRFTGKPLDSDAVKAVITAGEARLNGNGRLLIRKSGTEPVIRVMAEGEDKQMVKAIVDEICAAVVAA